MSGAENTNPATRNEIMNDIINHSDRAYDWRMVLLNAVRYADPFFPRRICISVTDWCNRKCSWRVPAVHGGKILTYETQT